MQSRRPRQPDVCADQLRRDGSGSTEARLPFRARGGSCERSPDRYGASAKRPSSPYSWASCAACDACQRQQDPRRCPSAACFDGVDGTRANDAARDRRILTMPDCSVRAVGRRDPRAVIERCSPHRWMRRLPTACRAVRRAPVRPRDSAEAVSAGGRDEAQRPCSARHYPLPPRGSFD